MATRPKAVIESRNGEKFSPITIAKNVLTDDGQNLHDILSDRKEDMMTPTIENSSSMFKVGQGDNVDLSDNVMDGAYEDVVLKGKSLVNVIQGSSKDKVVLPYSFEEGETVTINDTHTNGRVEVEVKGRTLVNLVLEYNISDRYLRTPLNHPIVFGRQYLVRIFNCPINFKGVTIHNKKATYQYTYIPINKPWTSNNSNVTYDGLELDLLSDDNIQLTDEEKQNIRILFVEYQEGMENWDIPYFEGMASVQAPTVKTCGKNLFDKATSYGGWVSNETGETLEKDTLGKIDNIVSDYIKVIPSEQYVSNTSLYQWYYDGNKKFIKNSNITGAKIIPPSNAKYVVLGKSISRSEANFQSVLESLQLEKGTSSTAYERYQSSSLTLPEEVVLRGLPNGVCDAYNTKTKEYVQRIGEYVITGDEPFTIADAGSGLYRLQISNPTFLPNIKCGSTICDKLKGLQGNDRYLHGNSDGKTHYIGYTSDKWLRLVIDETITTVQQGKDWLSGNLVTFQYELAEPIITKVDLPSLKAYDTVTHLSSTVGEGSLIPILASDDAISYPVVIKPNTKYSIIANSYRNYHTNSAINFNLGGATNSTTVGNRVTTITTPSTLSNELLTMSGRGNELNNVMVIEGDVVGDEPYFEGICDCKSPILTNVGKNLFLGTMEQGSIAGSDGQPVFATTRARSTNFIKLKKDNTYTFSVTSLQVDSNIMFREFLTYSIDNYNSYKVGNLGTYKKQFTYTPTDDEYIKFVLTNNTTPEGVVDINAVKIQIEQNTQATVYEDCKSNTTTFSTDDNKTIVLRSLPNGVCDTLNVRTGEYVQNIGEVVLDGSQRTDLNYHAVLKDNDDKFLRMIINGCSFFDKSKYGVCDKLPFYHTEQLANPIECVYPFKGEEHFYIKIKDSRLNVASDSELRSKFLEWLSQNPITVQYELATPIVKQVNVEGYPYAYENGHILLESGSQEQSLTPTIEYSVVTNRNGQIRSNQKMVERHQKQLDRLQAMVLTNLVNTQYEQTLTNLKYDLKNVREEVK